MAGACAGIRVLECSQGAAGSLATMMLADFGADVIRLERPAGDTEATPADLLLNRGKRSVLLRPFRQHRPPTAPPPGDFR